MADLAKLVVKLEAESSKLRADLEKSTQRLQRFEQRTITASASIKKAFAGLVTVGSVAAFKNMITGVIEDADKLQKLSVRLGASTEALSQFKHVADLSGVSFETLTMGLQRMTRRIAEASKGGGEAVKALDELGVSAAKLKALRPEDQFTVLAQRISQVKDPADRVRLAMKLFDSEGVALLQTMENGAAGINQMRAEADRLGLTLSDKTAKKMAALNDKTTVLNARFNALKLSLASGLVPALSETADFANLFAGNTSIEDWAVRSTDSTRFLAQFMKTLSLEFKSVGKSIGALAAIDTVIFDDKLTTKQTFQAIDTIIESWRGDLKADSDEAARFIQSLDKIHQKVKAIQTPKIPAASLPDVSSSQISAPPQIAPLSKAIAPDALGALSKPIVPAFIDTEGVERALRPPAAPIETATRIMQSGSSFSDRLGGEIVNQQALEELNRSIEALQMNGVEFAADQLEKLREPFVSAAAVDITDKLKSGAGGGTLSFFSMEEVFKNMGILEEDVSRVQTAAEGIDMDFPNKAAEALDSVDRMVAGIDAKTQQIGFDFDKGAVLEAAKSANQIVQDYFKSNPIRQRLEIIPGNSLSSSALSSGSR